MPGCSDAATPPPTAADAGPDAEDAGLPTCAAGELELLDHTCQAAGIPPGSCAAGFVPSDEGCDPVLPARKCPPGEMAVPGETRCHEPMPCGDGTWGDIPVEANTEHVDAAYGGMDSDGSPGKPWTTIGQAYVAADPGAIIAVAAGTYTEDVVLTKVVRLWGRCPGLVEIVGQDPTLGAIDVLADEVEIRGVSAQGPGGGIAMSGARDVVVEGVHVHDTQAFAGVAVFDQFGPVGLVLRDSLVERTFQAGVGLFGGSLTMERCVVRDPLAGDGTAIRAIASPATKTRADLTVRTSSFDDNRFVALYVAGGDALLDGIVVRGTTPNASGEGGAALLVRDDPVSGEVGVVTLTGSVLENNRYIAAEVLNANLSVERTVIRDTSSQPSDEAGGAALTAGPGPEALPTTLLARESVLLRNHYAGVSVAGTKLTMEGVVVRDTDADGSGRFGRGIAIQVDEASGIRSVAELSGLVIARSRETGIVVLGSDATIEGAAITDGLGQAIDGMFGRGISVGKHSGAPASASVTRSRVERARDVGLHVSGAQVTVSDSSILDTLARAADGQYGDGVAVDGEDSPASVAIAGCEVRGSARAGIGNFAAAVTLEGTRVLCNLIDLNGEPLMSSFQFADGGGNVCGCDAETHECKVLSSGLEPPAHAP